MDKLTLGNAAILGLKYVTESSNVALLTHNVSICRTATNLTINQFVQYAILTSIR